MSHYPLGSFIFVETFQYVPRRQSVTLCRRFLVRLWDSRCPWLSLIQQGNPAGRGVSSVYDGKEVIAGNAELLNENGIAIDAKALSNAKGYLKNGCTIIYVSIDGAFGGFIALSDTIRPESVKIYITVSVIGRLSPRQRF